MMGIRTEWLGTARVKVCLLAVMVAAGLVPVMSRQASWLGSWKMALDWGTSSITMLGPVAAGIACTVYVRIRRAHLPELLSQAPRSWAGWVAPAVAVWLLGSLGVLLICAFTTTAAWATGANGFPTLYWVVLPALVVLAAEVAVGALIGSAVGSYWAAPWAAVATFALFILSSISVLPGVFDTGGVTGALSGETFDARVLTLQAVAALGMAAGAMALSHGELFRVSSLATRVATGVAVAGTVVALFQLADDHERYVALDRVEYECAGQRPTVCMLEETTRPLEDLATTMQRLAAPLIAAGVRIPDRFIQSAQLVHDPSSGAINLFSEEELSADVSDETAARSLSQPADCPAYYSDSPGAFPDVVFTIDRILVRWILIQAGQETAPTDGGLAEWWALPVEEQGPWLRQTYAALRECRLFSLRIPQ